MFAVILIQPKTGILRWLNIVFAVCYFRRLFVFVYDDLSCSLEHDFSTFVAQQALFSAAARESIDS